MIFIILVLAAAFLAPTAATAQSRFPGACGLLPSFCEMKGRVLDTQRCRCVKPPSHLPQCELAPFFCEFSGQVLDTRLCRCVDPGGRANRDSIP
jgi:hypothetical protein